MTQTQTVRKTRNFGTGKTKTDRILKDLLKGAIMTHFKALAYGTYRLADVIYRLRKQGWIINDRQTTAVDGTRYTEYFMPDRVKA